MGLDQQLADMSDACTKIFQSQWGSDILLQLEWKTYTGISNAAIEGVTDEGEVLLHYCALYGGHRVCF